MKGKFLGLPREHVECGRGARESLACLLCGATRRRIGRAKIGKFDIGGGDGNRTRVREQFNKSYYMLSISFGASP